MQGYNGRARVPRFTQRAVAYALSSILTTSTLAQTVTPLQVIGTGSNAAPALQSTTVAGTDIDDATVNIYPSRDGMHAHLDLAIFSRSAGSRAMYLNVFVDVDKDGQLDSTEVPGFQEWPVRNFPVMLNGDGTTVLRHPAVPPGTDPVDPRRHPRLAANLPSDMSPLPLFLTSHRATR